MSEPQEHQDISVDTTTASPARPPRLLVVAPAWIGDVVIAQSLLMLLRQQQPRARIEVLALDWARPILARMPEVDDVVEFPAPHGTLRLAALRRKAREVASRDYDQAIVLRNNVKSALVPWMARIPRRTGFRGEMRYGLLNDIRPLDASQLTSRVAEYLALGVTAGESPPARPPQPRLKTDPQNRDRLMAELGLTGDRPVIAIAPGASFGAAKRWPLTHYLVLARSLVAAGYAVWVLGSPAEAGMGETIAGHASAHAHNLCGRTTLSDVIDLMTATACMVGADSGLTHIAAASAPRVVGIYGPTSPGYAPPLSDNSVRLWHGLACSPCGERECPLGHANCMSRIDVASVLAACTGTEAPLRATG